MGSVGAPLILPWLIIGIAALMFYVRFNVDLSLKTVMGTQIVCTFPLVTAIVAAQLFRFQRVQEEAAIDLGCSRMQVLRYIILPHIAPALAASAIFAFTWSFNNYEISAFTIGFQQTFPVWVYSNVRNPDHTAVVNSISAVISLVQVLLIWAALHVAADAHRRRRDARHARGHRFDGPGGEELRDGDGPRAPWRLLRVGAPAGSARGAMGILFAPVTLLVVLFLGPMVIMAAMSLLKFPPNTASGYTFSHYVDVLTNPLNLKIAWTTFWIATIAMIIMLAISIPLAYYMVFRAGKWELFLLLSLVLADELAPVVKIYAWQVILGRNGILNWLIPGPPTVVAAVQLVRRDRDARGHVHHVHHHPDLCRDEGDRRIDVRIRDRSRCGLVGAGSAHPDPAGGARHLHRDDPGVHPHAHRLRHRRHRGRHG